MSAVFYEGEGAYPLETRGSTLLEIARAGGVPHTATCGGCARCSTCRVLVLEGAENLAPRTEAEEALAKQKGLEPEVRLACQAGVHGPVRVRRLVRDQLDEKMVAAGEGGSSGREAEVAVLFSDIRDFTAFAERNLPYDVIHALNRYFGSMGEAVLRHGGHIDKYIGDGLMALFGIDARDAADASRRAVRAALEMLDELESLNSYLGMHVGTHFEVGIGIHVGDVVVGNLGHPQRMQLSAIGDTVNVASRIETATKEHGARLLVSDAVYGHVASEIRAGRRFERTLKGKRAPVVLHEIVGAAGSVGPGEKQVNEDAK